jgi:hypothetical protein
MENQIKETISEHNLQVYMDMAKDMLKKKGGIFSFIIRIDGKHIVDYVQLDSFVYSEITVIKWKQTK